MPRRDAGDWTGGAFEWIASAGGVEPDGWVDRWGFNQAACWNTEASAWAVAPEKESGDYHLYAYRLLPVFYRGSEAAVRRSLDQIFDLMKGKGGLPDEAGLEGYASLGFDVIGIGEMNIGPTIGFQTSPLSTSGMWPKAPVNRFSSSTRWRTPSPSPRSATASCPSPSTTTWSRCCIGLDRQTQLENCDNNRRADMVHHVKDLSLEERRAVERLLGRSVSEDETVSIKSVRASALLDQGLSAEERQLALDRLSRYFAKVDEQRQPVSLEEEEAIITEALRSTRPGYRPVH